MLNEKRVFWIILLLVTGFFLCEVSNILTPFISAIIISYFLNPLVNKLQTYRVPRVVAGLLVLLLFFSIIIIASIKLLPLIYVQISEFMLDLPKYSQVVHDIIIEVISKLLGVVDESISDKIQQSLGDITSLFFKYIGISVSNIISSGVEALNILSLFIIIPIITFYILKDFDKMASKIEELIPVKSKRYYHELFIKIDEVLSGFIRGQTNVCFILALYYSFSLYILGLNFALFIGFATGILAFIPYVGISFGLISSIVIALIQFDDVKKLFVVLCIFVVGQVVEGNLLSPKLVGEKIGLHPAWLFFALLAGGSLFGFVGVLIAVPSAAVIGVLIRAFIQKYLSSSYYK